MSTDQPQSLTPGQRQTLKARESFAARFTNPQAKREHYRELARRAKSCRVTLGAGKAAELAEAFAVADPKLRTVEELAAVWTPLASILGDIAERVARRRPDPDLTEPDPALRTIPGLGTGGDTDRSAANSDPSERGGRP